MFVYTNNKFVKVHNKLFENSDEQHAIFARELQSAVRLTVGFSDIYCELKYIFHLNIKLDLK